MGSSSTRSDRVGNDRDREADALGLPAGELLGTPVGDIGQAGCGQHLVDGHRHRVERRGERDELAHGELVDERSGLEHRADRHRPRRRRRGSCRTATRFRDRGARARAACRWWSTCRLRSGRGWRRSRPARCRCSRLAPRGRRRTTFRGPRARCPGLWGRVLRSCTHGAPPGGLANSRRRDHFAMTNVMSAGQRFGSGVRARTRRSRHAMIAGGS